LDPGWKKFGSEINFDADPGWKKILILDGKKFGSGIRDGKNSDTESAPVIMMEEYKTNKFSKQSFFDRSWPQRGIILTVCNPT
jgi:hypothetical protein